MHERLNFCILCVFLGHQIVPLLIARQQQRHSTLHIGARLVQKSLLKTSLGVGQTTIFFFFLFGYESFVRTQNSAPESSFGHFKSACGKAGMYPSTVLDAVRCTYSIESRDENRCPFLREKGKGKETPHAHGFTAEKSLNRLFYFFWCGDVL